MKVGQLFLAGFLWVVVLSSAPAVTLYVDLNSTNPVPPYADWSTAATDIQDAVDAANPGDQILVTNGVYQTGGRTVNGYALTNRVVIDKAITVQSVNGPALTIIQGYQVPGTTNGGSAVRCVYLTNNAALIGFTLINGATQVDPGLINTNEVYVATGGGVWCESTNAIVSNCVLSANTADFKYDAGGGAYSGTLLNCVLTENSAAVGGGAYNSVLNNCALTNNSAVGSGGGASQSTLNDCRLNGNSSSKGGGASGCILSNCSITDNSSGGYGGGIFNSILNGCIISSNSSGEYGGGSYNSSLTNCAVTGNTSTMFGGGAYGGVLYECNIAGNSAVTTSSAGGGAYSATLIQCTLTGNTAPSGGGADLGTLSNCILSGNVAFNIGGGVNSATVNNSALIDNLAINSGGGASGSVLNNCTLAGNSAFAGGGALSSSLTNCIVYYNQAVVGTNYDASTTLSYCCTTPIPTNGLGNITDEPQLADLFHLSSNSPCLGAGNPAYATGVDIDGEPWANPPAIGCDEFYTGSITGQLDVAIEAAYTNVATGFSDGFIAQISGHATASFWDFGDGARATNQPYVFHAWNSPGDYPVILTVFNESYPGGVSTSVTVHVMNQPVHYVALGNLNPVAPYLSWATAATNIQDAVDAAFGGSEVLVSNGVYQTGGRVAYGSLTNRVVITKAVTLQSVNGPAVTTIQGYQIPGVLNGDSAVRCAFLMDGATLDGFTLTGGATHGLAGYYLLDGSGGGLWCQSANVLVANCLIVSNSCRWWGAGAYGGTLSNCLVNGNLNSSTGFAGGGGAAYSTLLNSTISGNIATNGGGNIGGGALSCALSNCVVSGNTDGGVSSSTLNNCVISGNSTHGNGGGAYQSTLNSCFIYSNVATNGNGTGNGGGLYDCSLNFCTISNNAAIWGGGVAFVATDIPGQGNIVVGNKASVYGGGCVFPANTNLSNWSFISNSAATDGGGLYLASAVATVSGCTFLGNSAGGNGGGLSGVSPNFNPVSNCVFTGNVAAGNGGGAYYAVLNNCTIAGNRARFGGGVYGGIEGCVVNGNIATMNGGGVYFGGVSYCTNSAFTNNVAFNGGGAYEGAFTNCIFSGNLAISNGGAVFQATLENCLIVSNQAAFGGGGYNGAGYSGTYVGCSILGNSATNSGGGIYCMFSFQVTNCLFGNNSAANSGGGAYGGVLGHCTILGNVAANGGGVFSATLNRCSLSNNCAGADGGGASGSSLANCLLVGNSATYGGGAYNGSVFSSTVVGNVATNAGGGIYFSSSGSPANSIVYYNVAPAGANYSGGNAFNNCCTIPLPPSGSGNITNAPAFINQAAGNYRLQTNSPCVDAGSGGLPGTIDLDGCPRVVGSKIDIGAYEFQGPGMGEFIGWLQQYGLPTDGSVDDADLDGTGFNVYQDWIAGLNPTNSLSVLAMLPPVSTNNPSGLVLSWESVNTRTYFLQSSTNLAQQPAFTTVQSNIVGQAGTTTYTDTAATNGGPYFYRVGVQ